jgi:hypothetical protein
VAAYKEVTAGLANGSLVVLRSFGGGDTDSQSGKGGGGLKKGAPPPKLQLEKPKSGIDLEDGGSAEGGGEGDGGSAGGESGAEEVELTEEEVAAAEAEAAALAAKEEEDRLEVSKPLGTDRWSRESGGSWVKGDCMAKSSAEM